MSKQPPKGSKRTIDADGPEDDGASSFAWEFGNDDPSGNRPIPTPRAAARPRQTDARASDEGRANTVRPKGAAPSSPQVDESRMAGKSRRATATVLPAGGAFGPARANYVRDQLDRALDRWWAAGEMPPLLLLRDGLLLLEAGGSASESQRTLLLRAALAYDKGVQTALRHQVDAERVALVLAETLVEWEIPLDPARLTTILAGDEQTLGLLIAELERSRILLTGEPRRRAEFALALLPRPAKSGRVPVSPPPPVAAVYRGRRPLRQLLLVLLVIAFIGFILWQQQRQRTPEGMVKMPAATYGLVGRNGVVDSVALNGYLIDRFEVTNRQYRTCLEQNVCDWPTQTSSRTRQEYFTNPAFDSYPVVNVSQTMAAGYCVWQEKRLPTVAEWQAAASVSTTTGQTYRFPWGEQFEPQRTNGLASGIGDTLTVGSFRPAGDSASGLADMAGNVAEWTSTLLSDEDGDTRAIVKGGSFLSGEDALVASAGVNVEIANGLPAVGFRCAKDDLLTNK